MRAVRFPPRGSDYHLRPPVSRRPKALIKSPGISAEEICDTEVLSDALSLSISLFF